MTTGAVPLIQQDQLSHMAVFCSYFASALAHGITDDSYYTSGRGKIVPCNVIK